MSPKEIDHLSEAIAKARDPYLATGRTPRDVEWVIAQAIRRAGPSPKESIDATERL